MIAYQDQQPSNHITPGYYIYIDATCISGPYETKQAAVDSLSPENRKKWTWELGEDPKKGFEQFLAMSIQEFSIIWED